MKLKHKTPCKECPWRKESLQGYLGGHAPEYYADAVANNEVPACHLQDHGPEDDRTAFCAGALSCMANQAMQPSAMHPGQETAVEAREEVGKRDDTFWHHALFYKYHAGKDYLPPFLRGIDE
tara:strand:+ start:155 stop:520 length:366 start_codon:yes stop_codon:yes gene_type:complete